MHYLYKKNNEIVGCSGLFVSNPDFECVECSKEEYDEYLNRILSKHKQISQLKAELNKYKEDVEQVELFSMKRADYEQKKARCAKIIIELRKLESEVRDVNL